MPARLHTAARASKKFVVLPMIGMTTPDECFNHLTLREQLPAVRLILLSTKMLHQIFLVLYVMHLRERKYRTVIDGQEVQHAFRAHELVPGRCLHDCFDVRKLAAAAVNTTRKLDRNDRNDAHVTPASSYVLNCEARTGLLRVIYMVHGCIDRHPCIAAYGT